MRKRERGVEMEREKERGEEARDILTNTLDTLGCITYSNLLHLDKRDSRRLHHKH